MRRKDREVTDFSRMLQVLEACDVCRLGFVDEDSAYIVPMNFGFEEIEGHLCLYFHGATQGKKLDLLPQQKFVSFEMDTAHELVIGKSPCAYSYKYQSIIGKGTLEILSEKTQKIHGMNLVIKHYTKSSDNFDFPEAMLCHVAILRFIVKEWTCKIHD